MSAITPTQAYPVLTSAQAYAFHHSESSANLVCVPDREKLRVEVENIKNTLEAAREYTYEYGYCYHPRMWVRACSPGQALAQPWVPHI